MIVILPDAGLTADRWRENADAMLRWAEERPAYFRQYLGIVEAWFGE